MGAGLPAKGRKAASIIYDAAIRLAALRRALKMAQELYTRTNQKLFFAGLALESVLAVGPGAAGFTVAPD